MNVMNKTRLINKQRKNRAFTIIDLRNNIKSLNFMNQLDVASPRRYRGSILYRCVSSM